MARGTTTHSSTVRPRLSPGTILLAGPVVLFDPAPALAADAISPHINGAALGLEWGLPFLGILLSIALTPLLAPKFWHHHFGKVSTFWVAALLIPFAASFGLRVAVYETLHALLLEYVPFILLLFALFVVAGGIRVVGNLVGTPGTNTAILAFGTMIASLLGTTGAAMLLIRPLVRANQTRRRNVHVFVFFIFLVANIGGSLTPLGDPPLFLGFLHGVDFTWTLRAMFVPMLLCSAILLATSWHSNKFLNPARDGAVLPILHLNGFKIANPTILARISRQELTDLMRGYGYDPHFVEGDDPAVVHQSLAATLDAILAQIRQIQSAARSGTAVERPRWPMIVFRMPKGWTGPKFVDGKPVEGTWRAHQVPIADFKNPEHLQQLEEWMKSYRPQELFDEHGKFREEFASLAPTGHCRMGSNPHANGGELLRPLTMPHFHDYAVPVPRPGGVQAEATRVLGSFLRDVMKLNLDKRNFRLFGPDETASNRLDAVYEVSRKEWMADIEEVDIDLGPDGRVMEVLSEHLCEGWLEGYLLTGRHGLFSCYEAFVHIIDSMFNQHAKWLKVSRKIPWRKPIASLNYLLTSHVWRQDHNGFSHQDPGFIDHVANKKSEIVRIYLPPDANCLLSVADHCLRSRDYINLIVAGKQPEWQWLDIDAAVRHCTVGAGIWRWAGNGDVDPDVVMACAGDIPTLETLAAVTLLREYVPDIRIRVVNVVDLMVLQPQSEHPHGLEDQDFDELFTVDKPVIFAFHGYPAFIHKLTYRRHNHDNIHVRGYKEEGTTTTPFDMVVLNNLDRYQLALDAIQRIPRLADQVAKATARYWSTMERHKLYISEHGDDLPEVRDWRWTA